MNIDKSEQITSSQLFFTIIGALSAIEAFELPNILVKYAGRDSWLAIISGAVYPIYIIIIGAYIIKNRPDENILEIYKRKLGAFFGNVFNFLFLIQYIIYIGTVTATFTKISTTYTVAFLPPNKIIFLSVLVSGFAAFYGLKVVAKINELISFLTLSLVLFTIPALKSGNILNITPLFKSSLKEFYGAFKESMYYYTSIELIVLIHPYLKNKKNAVKPALLGLTATTFIFTWVVFISIYSFGINVVSKSHYPLLMVIDTIPIPVFNNIRTIYMFLWNLVEFVVITNMYFLLVFIASNIIKIDMKKLCMFIFPLAYIAPQIFLNDHIMTFTFKYIIPFITVYNIIFVTLGGILSRPGKKQEES